jgi:hypothetical protein
MVLLLAEPGLLLFPRTVDTEFWFVQIWEACDHSQLFYRKNSHR